MPKSDSANWIEPSPEGQRIAIVGRFASMNRQQAAELLRTRGAEVLDRPDATATWIVVGDARSAPGGLSGIRDQLDPATRAALDAGRAELFTEADLWRRFGLVEFESLPQLLYTPAMLAELLHVDIATIRAWQRKGLIQPVREVRRLPYFDFREVTTARRIQELVRAGISLGAIAKQLVELERLFPNIRPLAELPILIDGKRLLVRQPEGLSETGGQLRFDFEEIESEEPKSDLPREGAADHESPRRILTIALGRAATEGATSPSEIVRMALELEEADQLTAAAEMYRAALAAGGPNAEGCFLLAELLYRLGDISGARERYYMAIELNEDYVEARANLGCVLVEQGQFELAVAAFQGALAFHPEYADVHYHLARVLDDLNHHSAAEEHWRTFLDLSPETPWADEARERLAVSP